MILDIPGMTERRQTPRYDVKIPVDLVLDNGNIFTVETKNISSCGLQINCDAWITDEIEPRGIQSHSINHIRLKVVTNLPVADGSKKFYANCRILSVQRMSQNVYMISLAFIDFENGTESVLDEFLDQYEQKKTVIDSYA